MQCSTCGTEGIDPALNILIILKRRSVKVLFPGINDQAATTTPVLDMGEGFDPFNITGGRGPRKSHPEQVFKVPCGELCIIDNHDQWEVIDLVVLSVGATEGGQIC